MSTLPEVVSVSERLATITSHWRPKLIAELNGQAVKLSRLKGEFIWHRHDEADELFLVLEGTLRLEFRDGARDVGPGELLVVPAGMEHRPVAEDEVAVLLFEPLGVRNTGNVEDATLTAPTDAR